MKEILLDTHSLLWFLIGSPKLSPLARSLIDDSSVQPFLSVASLWEIAIKVSLGKLVLAPPLEELISHQFAQNGIALLEIQPKHLVVVSQLPYHHRDPFDRLMISQAIVEQLPIVSCDTLFEAYPITRLW